MSLRSPPRWSNRWLREMSWRELEEIHRAVLTHGIPVSPAFIASRLRRAEAEWDRRKKEGGGGWAAKADRL